MLSSEWSFSVAPIEVPFTPFRSLFLVWNVRIKLNPIGECVGIVDHPNHHLNLPIPTAGKIHTFRYVPLNRT